MANEASNTFTVTLENLLIVTHAVPVERVRPRVPKSLELDVLKGPEGEDVALISTTCFLNRDLQWPQGSEPILDFHQATYRTYIKYNEEPAVYILGSFIERGTPSIFERLSAKNAFAADFDISLSYDPSNRSYRRYYCEVLSEKGDTIIEVKSGGEEPRASIPFDTGLEMAHFITQRPANLYSMSDGGLGCLRLEHEEMNPVDAEILAGEFDYWGKLGILREEEFELPYCVLIQPDVEIKGELLNA